MLHKPPRVHAQNGREQTAESRQKHQTPNSRQQTPNSRQRTADTKQQTSDSRQQTEWPPEEFSKLLMLVVSVGVLL
jgi:hypothetical protein